MSYTPPAGDNVNFKLAPFTPPAGDAVNFQLQADTPEPSGAVVKVKVSGSFITAQKKVKISGTFQDVTTNVV